MPRDPAKDNEPTDLAPKEGAKSDAIDPEIVDIIKRDPEAIMDIVARETQFFQSGPASPFGQLGDEQINKVLEGADKHDDREFRFVSSANEREHETTRMVVRYTALVIVAVLALAGVVIVTYKEKPEYVAPILAGLSGFGAGGVGGYGIGVSRSKKRNSPS